MNNIYCKTIVSAALSLVLLVSCDMDVIPPSDIAAESFWNTDKDAWYALNACYRQLPGFDIGDEMYTDDAHSHKPWEGPYELIQQDYITPEYDVGYSYTGIRMFNNFIENVEKCTMDETLKTRMKAEARFLRAFHYIDLTTKFGDVPLVKEVMPYDAPNIPRDAKETVHAFILSELTEIAEILPRKYSGTYLNEYGRFTRAAALALKARAALFFGDFAAAEAASKTVIDEGDHSLFRVTTLTQLQQKEADEMDAFIDYDIYGIDKDKFAKGLFSYETLWHSENASPNNPEYIVTRQYMAADYQEDYARYIYIRPSQMIRGYSSYEPTQDIIDAYWFIDGKTYPAPVTVEDRKNNFDIMNQLTKEWVEVEKKTFSELVPTLDLKSFDYMQEFRNRDSRLYGSMLFPFKGWHETDAGVFYYRWFPEKIGTDGNESWSGYSYRKMVAKTPYNTQNSFDDYPVLRYAEVLLTYAEARIRNVGWDSSAQMALNDLRDRCGMPNVPTTMPSTEEALAFVWNERRIELAGEGIRYEDIRRYGNEYAAKYMNGSIYAPNGSVLVTKAWSNRLLYMPIPQSAIDLNPLLEQNPGY